MYKLCLIKSVSLTVIVLWKCLFVISQNTVRGELYSVHYIYFRTCQNQTKWTASQTEGDIQCIQSRLVHPENTDYPVSTVLYFWDSFFCISCLFFISLNCFFSNDIFFLCWLHCFIVLFFFPCLIINFFLSFLSITFHEHVANSILYCPTVLYFSSIFLMASTSEAIPFMFLVYWIEDVSLSW